MDRPDWGSGDHRGGGESRAVATTEAKPTSLAEVKPGDIVPGPELARLAQQDGRAVAPSGLAPDLVKEMRHSMDGYDATLASMQSAATAILDEEFGADAEAFKLHFDTLADARKYPSGKEVETAIFRDLMKYPNSAPDKRFDRVYKRGLTLQAEVDLKAWWRAWMRK